MNRRKKIHARWNSVLFIPSLSLAAPSQKPFMLLPRLSDSPNTEEALDPILGPLPISALSHSLDDLIQSRGFKYHLFVLIICSGLSSVL